MAKTMYDPWSKIITRNGYAGDEVNISFTEINSSQFRRTGHVCSPMKCYFLHRNY